MTTTNRTFKILSPHMKGSDVASWQGDVKAEFLRMGIACPIKIDGDYGISSRGYTASLCTALGMTASKVMAEGVTPELRIRIRNRRLTSPERSAYENRQDYRRALREKYASSVITRVHRPVGKNLEDGWGFHPGAHDGVDVQTLAKAPLYAMVKGRVFDVRSSGWWGKAPSGDVSLGDGIVQYEVLENIGPFIKGYHIGYGHCENARVKDGDIVEPGDRIADSGLAVVYHIHLMYNNGSTTKGIGNLDPRPILDYAELHG